MCNHPAGGKEARRGLVKGRDCHIEEPTSRGGSTGLPSPNRGFWTPQQPTAEQGPAGLRLNQGIAFPPRPGASILRLLRADLGLRGSGQQDKFPFLGLIG